MLSITESLSGDDDGDGDGDGGGGGGDDSDGGDDDMIFIVLEFSTVKSSQFPLLPSQSALEIFFSPTPLLPALF